MTTNKDQKRLIRARMQKTGESYTAARAVLVARADADTPKQAAPRKEWAALAGFSDETVKDKTGRSWAQWVAVLDGVSAHRMSHRDIAKHLRETFEEVNSWWAQSLTVGYERIRGMREVGQSCTGSFDANKSRTFSVDVSTLYQMCKDARRRKKWLPNGVKKLRTAVEDRSLRLDWHDGTQVNLYFVPKGAAKSTLSIQHTKLAGKPEVAEEKLLWAARLDALGEAMKSG